MAKTFKVSDESVNAYGFRVLSSGMDASEFILNPVGLFNHQSEWDDENYAGPVAKWSNLVTVPGEALHPIYADVEFDMNDPKAALVANKVENGFINAASIGFKPIEWSEDAALMLPGQTGPTVTKWKLREISVCDFPANSNALVCFDEAGKKIDLKDPEAFTKLKLSQTQSKTPKPMEKISLSVIWTNILSFLHLSVPADSKAERIEAELSEDKWKELNDKLGELVSLTAKNTELEGQVLQLTQDVEAKTSEIVSLNATKTALETENLSLKTALGHQPSKPVGLGAGDSPAGDPNQDPEDIEFKEYLSEVDQKRGLVKA